MGKIIAGEVNPSGRTSDTFVADLTAAPTWYNSGSFVYDNMDEMAGYMAAYAIKGAKNQGSTPASNILQ